MESEKEQNVSEEENTSPLKSQVSPKMSETRDSKPRDHEASKSRNTFEVRGDKEKDTSKTLDGVSSEPKPRGDDIAIKPRASSSKPRSSKRVRKSRDLREATYHLREEAMRRYRLKHQHTWRDWSPGLARSASSPESLSKYAPLPCIPSSSRRGSDASDVTRSAPTSPPRSAPVSPHRTPAPLSPQRSIQASPGNAFKATDSPLSKHSSRQSGGGKTTPQSQRSVSASPQRSVAASPSESLPTLPRTPSQRSSSGLHTPEQPPNTPQLRRSSRDKDDVTDAPKETAASRASGDGADAERVNSAHSSVGRKASVDRKRSTSKSPKEGHTKAKEETDLSASSPKSGKSSVIDKEGPVDHKFLDNDDKASVRRSPEGSMKSSKSGEKTPKKKKRTTEKPGSREDRFPADDNAQTGRDASKTPAKQKSHESVADDEAASRPVPDVSKTPHKRVVDRPSSCKRTGSAGSRKSGSRSSSTGDREKGDDNSRDEDREVDEQDHGDVSTGPQRASSALASSNKKAPSRRSSKNGSSICSVDNDPNVLDTDATKLAVDDEPRSRATSALDADRAASEAARAAGSALRRQKSVNSSSDMENPENADVEQTAPEELGADTPAEQQEEEQTEVQAEQEDEEETAASEPAEEPVAEQEEQADEQVEQSAQDDDETGQAAEAANEPDETADDNAETQEEDSATQETGDAEQVAQETEEGSPTEKAGTPASQPGTPAEQAGTQAEQPATPVPGTPTEKHGTPAEQPGTPVEKPGTPVEKPGTPTSKPGTPVDKLQSETATPRAADSEDEEPEEPKKKVEEKTIADDFFYNYEDHVNKANVTADSGLPSDWISLHHSFGYDCTKRDNLHLLDQENVCFVAGNNVQILNMRTKEQKYLRSTSGGGIGALAVHPSNQYIAVGEKGDAPNINIFEYPSLKLYRILRGGTEAEYSYLDFSPDGALLASVGGEPDYMLTIWNWQQELIVLRSKAFSQDVYRVTFSTELEGQLTSSGINHIRFWKMADTFTGLKLQGDIGKFGRTEITDIEGYVELPDGKVLSGSEWGNMLLWDGGLIKVEISRKNKKLCHQGPIQQIVMDEGELMTVGADGCIRVWDFETIDTADTTDESPVFEMDPMNELKVGDVNLRTIIKSLDPEEPTVWFAQDAKGGIWKLDLSFSHTSMAPERLMSYTAGSILACDSSPLHHLVATGGADNSVRVYDLLQKQQLTEVKYNSPTTALHWASDVVDSKGSTILAGFEDGVVRVLRFLERSEQSGKRLKEQSQLLLFQAMKPHNGKVTCLGIDSTGDVLATGSEDGTIFFLSVGNASSDDFYEPIGFVTCPAPVTGLQWTPATFEKPRLLVMMQGGMVMDIEAPEPGHTDTSKTFQLQGLATRVYQFKSCKSRLRHDEEVARKEKEEAERKAAEEEERRRRLERGLEVEEKEEVPAKKTVRLEKPVKRRIEKPAEPEPEWVPYIPEEPSPILHGFYGKDEDTFWLSMGDFDAGYLYECKFMSEEELAALPEDKRNEPIRAVPVTDSQDTPITHISFSANGRQAFMGLESGCIRIQPVEESDLSTLGPHYTLAVHDNHYGDVVSLVLSHDNRYLSSVGRDGNLFTFEIMDEERVKEAVAANKAKIPSAKISLASHRVDDIDDPSTYSIEDAKQKAEHDRMLLLAEEKKHNVRVTINQLRVQFKKMLEMNQDDLPKHLQLSRREFEMDPGIKKELEKHTTDKMDLVRKELAWEAEKHRLALEKLRMKFMDVVECERVVVKAFQSRHEVCSFRASKLSDDFYAMRADMERRKTTFLTREDLSRDPSKDPAKDAAKLSEMAVAGQSKEGTETKVTTTLKGSMGERITKALNKVEEKKRKRAQRRAQWDELFATKPDEKFEDPADVAAIREAQEHMGDYKLKTADDYVVPDHLRMNVEKARSRLLVIKDLIHQHKYDFNQRLLTLRDRKIQIIEEIVDVVNELVDVQQELGVDKTRPLPAIPEMTIDEMPEKRLEYTREILKKFKKFVEERTLKEIKGADSGFGQSGSFVDASKALHGMFGIGVRIQPSRPVKALPAPTTDSGTDSSEPVSLTPLEQKLRRAREIKLLYQQDKLFDRIDDLVKTFDAELRLLNHDKYELDINLKNADLRHVTLFEELVLLKEFEKREDILAAKVEGKQQEKMDMQTKVLECQQKLEGKKKDIEKSVEKEKALLVQFQASLGEGNKFVEYLTKVFKKKIKRSKKKTTEEDSDEESDEESDDESDWSEEDEESDSEAGGYDLDVCPSGCDQSIYDSTCQLREKRLDIEEALAEEKKANEVLKKELENLQRKAKVIDSNLKTAEADLEAFQLEKQRKLNELDVVVTLKLHQIQYVVNSVLPQDLSQCLVFEAHGVTRLQSRIRELEHEKSLQKRQQKEAKKKHVQLIKDRKVFEKRICEMLAKCEEMMIQKFGRIVDLEKLETVTVNRQLEELKERLRQVEDDCAREIYSWNLKLEEKRDFITQLIRQNTERLQQLHMLTEEKFGYEKELDSRHQNLGSEYSGSRKADIHERQRLIQLVQLQAQEVEALKDEITLLSRKGGHILPPAQPPMSGSHRPISVHNT